MAKRNSLDKFYTKTEVAQTCLEFLNDKVSLSPNSFFLEPSAGNGKFSSLLDNCEAYDIQPEAENIIEADFLKVELNKSNYITVGNPPFGTKCSLAIAFFNKCAQVSDIIAFIVPVTFMKWSVQSQLSKDFKLIDFFYLEENSFVENGKDYCVRCVFQIWVKKKCKYDSENLPNYRLLKVPPISHPDFNIWQHNATPASRKYVDENWEIATWRQGYKDYNKFFTREDYDEIKDKVENTNLQFFFIEPLNEQARKIIYNMDFNQLAKRNLSTPGFGKADFVGYYIELKNRL
jgi:hypothetical protein